MQEINTTERISTYVKYYQPLQQAQDKDEYSLGPFNKKKKIIKEISPLESGYSYSSTTKIRTCIQSQHLAKHINYKASKFKYQIVQNIQGQVNQCNGNCEFNPLVWCLCIRNKCINVCTSVIYIQNYTYIFLFCLFTLNLKALQLQFSRILKSYILFFQVFIMIFLFYNLFGILCLA